MKSLVGWGTLGGFIWWNTHRIGVGSTVKPPFVLLIPWVSKTKELFEVTILGRQTTVCDYGTV